MIHLNSCACVAAAFPVFITNLENLVNVKCREVVHEGCLWIIYLNACACVPAAFPVFRINLENLVKVKCR